MIYEVLWSFQPFFIFSLLPLQASRLTFKGLGRDIERSWQKSTQIQTGGKYQLESSLFLVSLHHSCFPFRKGRTYWMSLSTYSPQVSAMHATRHTHTHTHTFQSSLYSENRKRSSCCVCKGPQQSLASPFPKSDKDRISLLGRGGNINELYYKYQWEEFFLAVVSPVMKYVRLDGASRLGAPHTRHDPRSEQWISCHICCHRNRTCSGKRAPRQPPGTGHRSGSLTGRRGWSAAGSLVEGSHRTAHCEEGGKTEENFWALNQLVWVINHKLTWVPNQKIDFVVHSGKSCFLI